MEGECLDCLFENKMGWSRCYCLLNNFDGDIHVISWDGSISRYALMYDIPEDGPLPFPGNFEFGRKEF